MTKKISYKMEKIGEQDAHLYRAKEGLTIEEAFVYYLREKKLTHCRSNLEIYTASGRKMQLQHKVKDNEHYIIAHIIKGTNICVGDIERIHTCPLCGTDLED